MNSTSIITLRPVVLAVGFTILCGCAGVPRPVQELDEATAALQSARSIGAPQHAAQQWQIAQDKFGRASQMLEQKQNSGARRALQQVTVDARLAQAIAQLQLRNAEQRTLQEEIDELQKRIKEVEQSTQGYVQE